MILRLEVRRHSRKEDLAPGTGRVSVALCPMTLTVPIAPWWAAGAHRDTLPPTWGAFQVLDLHVESSMVRTCEQRP